jgi:hypothetical protein
MDLGIRIENNTTFTPQLTAVGLVGLAWYPYVGLAVGDSIAGGGAIVGIANGNAPFNGSITLRFYHVPAPVGAAVDVTLTFNSDGGGGIAHAAQALPALGVTTQVQYQVAGTTHFLILTITP